MDAQQHQGCRAAGAEAKKRPIGSDMSTTTITEQGGSAAAPPADDQMEQIRELLVGEQQRHSTARLDKLEERITALEGAIERGLDALAARIEAVGSEAAAGQHAAFEKLSQGVVELGERIRGLGKSGSGGDSTV
jgi:hypothetical protein